MGFPAHGPRYDETFPDADRAGNRSASPVRISAQIRQRRETVRDRQDRARHVCRAIRRCRNFAEGRPGPCDADHRAGAGTFCGGDRPTLAARNVGRRVGRGRRRDVAIPPEGVRAAAGGGGGIWASASCARSSCDGSGCCKRRGRPRPDWRAQLLRRHPAAGLPEPQLLSSSLARSRHRPGSQRTDRALRRVRRPIAAGCLSRRRRAQQSLGNRACAAAGNDRRPRADFVYDVAVVGAGPGGPRHRRLRDLRGAFRRRSRRARVRRPGRRQRAHRELFRISHRHHGPGADGSRLRPGAEVRRRNDDPLGRAERSTARAKTGLWRSRSKAARRSEPEPSSSRAAQDIATRPSPTLPVFEGRGVWYWASPIRSQALRRRGSHSGRRRQFRGPGRGFSFVSCGQRSG